MYDKFESKFTNFQGKYRNRSVTKSVIFIKAKYKQQSLVDKFYKGKHVPWGCYG